MNADVKQKWLKALRSEEYEQGRGCLRSSNNKFCCLGILCDIYSKEHNVEWTKYSPDPESEYEYEILNHGASLPYVVMNWAGLDSDFGLEWMEGSIKTDLSIKNDHGLPFHVIADIIEEKL